MTREKIVNSTPILCPIKSELASKFLASHGKNKITRS